MRKLFRLLKREKGQAVVEAAIALPILLVILCGIIDFGWIFSSQLAVNNCSREGARLASVNSTNTDRVTQIQNRVSNVASSAINKDLTTTVQYSDNDVTVTVVSKVNVLTPISGIFTKDQQVTLKSSVTIRVE